METSMIGVCASRLLGLVGVKPWIPMAAHGTDPEVDHAASSWTNSESTCAHVLVLQHTA